MFSRISTLYLCGMDNRLIYTWKKIKDHLKKGIQEFHRKFVLAPADKAANNDVVV